MRNIVDPVYGRIPLNAVQNELLKTPEVQRLGWIHQLSLSKILFPGATHTRLEHLIGTSYLGKIAAEKLEMTNEDQTFMSVAGLLHDIGHAPFSHALEPLLKIGHEAYGTQLITGKSSPNIPGAGKIPTILEKHGINPNELAKTIMGKTHNPKAKLIHSPIDVDRMDYLNRDALETGIIYGRVDWERLTSAFTIVDNDICVKDNSVSTLNAFLISRHHMYRSVYLNYKTRVAGRMLLKAGKQVQDKLQGFGELTDDQYLERLSKLGDYQNEITLRVKFNQLFKAEKIIRNIGTSEETKKKVWALFENENLEEELAKKSGIPSNYLIASLIVKPPEKRKKPEELNIKILMKNGEIKRLYDVSPLARAISEDQSVRSLAIFYTLPEYGERLRTTVDEMLK